MGGNISISLSLSMSPLSRRAGIGFAVSWTRHPHPQTNSNTNPSAAPAPQGLRPSQLWELPALVLPCKPSASSSSSSPLPSHVVIGSAADGGCAICFEQLEGGQEVRILPRCRHVYHRPCIDSWLLRSALCPICRDCPIHPGLASILEATSYG